MRYWYRTESYSGSGVRDPVEILIYEMYELENWSMLKELVNQCNNYRGEDASDSITSLNDPDELYSDDDELLPSETTIRNFIRLILSIIGLSSDMYIKYAIWLADNPKTVRSLYHGTGDDIDAYNIQGGIKLVDVGNDGVLFGFEELPTPKPLSSIISKEQFHII